MGLAGIGHLFGPWLGTAYALIGATSGATVVFLAAPLAPTRAQAPPAPAAHSVDVTLYDVPPGGCGAAKP